MSVTALASLLEVIGAALLIGLLPAAIIRYRRGQINLIFTIDYIILGLLMLLLGLVLRWSVGQTPQRVVALLLFALAVACVLIIGYVWVASRFFPMRPAMARYKLVAISHVPKQAMWTSAAMGAIAIAAGFATWFLPVLVVLIQALLVSVLGAFILTVLRVMSPNRWVMRWYVPCVGVLLLLAFCFSVAIEVYAA